ncbi:putative TIR domain, P-loop containing nucleoside triphosphate hydrolase [Helianthus debilis subsp. tardiflorus]
MASNSASSVQKSFKYDVFLSFRGEDTRKTFVDHLYLALVNKGIVTYKDDETIKKGERISEQLIRSIEDSRFYMIVFSKNYASSSWCLNELVEIMKCQKTTEHTAYPIFYDVEPTEVRHQSGAFGEAFAKLVAKHEKGSGMFSFLKLFTRKRKRTSEEVELDKEEDVGRWRYALNEAAGLAGMELKNTFNGHEAKFIQQIVEEVSLKLYPFNPRVDGKLVGMETRVKNVVASLDIDTNDVRLIGIKGMGGAGKTTLARAVFDRISIRFEGKSFVENVREISKDYGLKELQRHVLSTVLNDQSIFVPSVSDGKNMMKKIMGSRKILLVLDDVDHIDQLEALAGESTWFKLGCRIIITTRDEQVLKAHGVNFIHDVNLLSNQDAICLLSRYAFGREIPNQGYEELSRMVIHYAAGLPLTIKLLGSFLYGRIEGEWKDTIKRLKTIPLKETQEKLELSYNGLENDQKEIFLDIACILKGKRKKKAIRVLESRGFCAQIALRVLEQKSLISISKDKERYCYVNVHFNDVDVVERLLLHDHIEEMGMNIVRRLHPHEPKRHSRLWIKEEIEDILVNELGTEETKGIKLKYTGLHPAIIEKGLRKMKELRYLYVDTIYDSWIVGEVSQYLPDSLQSLCWKSYPFQSLPESFQGYKLVNLQMAGSKISKLWEGGEGKVLNNLKFLDLHNSEVGNLNLGMTPHLEELNLQGCRDFVELHMPAVCPKLKYLNLSGSKVSNLNLGMTPHLEELNLEACYYLQQIHTPVGFLKRLVYLNFGGCWRFKCCYGEPLPPSKKKLKKHPSFGAGPLAKLQLITEFHFECFYDEPLPSSNENVEKLSFGLCVCTNFKCFSSSICALQHVRELTLKGSIPKVPKDLYQLLNLEKLILLKMTEIEHLPDSVCMLQHLKYLELKSCWNLEQLPDDLSRLECLEELHLTDCRSLQDVPDSICKIKSLTFLNLSGCFLVDKVPKELGCIERLKQLIISGTNISRLPQSIFQLKGLHIYGSWRELESCGFTTSVEFPDYASEYYVKL